MFRNLAILRILFAKIQSSLLSAKSVQLISISNEKHFLPIINSEFMATLKRPGEVRSHARQS